MIVQRQTWKHPERTPASRKVLAHSGHNQEGETIKSNASRKLPGKEDGDTNHKQRHQQLHDMRGLLECLFRLRDVQRLSHTYLNEREQM